MALDLGTLLTHINSDISGFEAGIKKIQAQIKAISKITAVINVQGDFTKINGQIQALKNNVGTASVKVQANTSSYMQTMAAITQPKTQQINIQYNTPPPLPASVSAATSGSTKGFGSTVLGAAKTGLAFGAIYGTISAMKQTASAEIELGQSLANLEANSQASAAQMETLKKTIMETGASSKFSLTEIADAATDLAKAGRSVDQVNSSMAASLEFAAANATDLGTAMNVVIASSSVYGSEFSNATDITDIFTKTAMSTNSEISDLGVAFKYAGGTAKALGIPLTDLMATLGAFSQFGIKGSQAGTAFRNVMFSLLDPSKKAAGALRELGLTPDTVTQGFTKMSEELEKAKKTMDNVKFDALIDRAFGRRGGTELISLLTDNHKALEQAKKDISDYEGITHKLSEIQLDTVAGQWQGLKNAMVGFFSEMNGNEGIKSVLKDLKEFFLMLSQSDAVAQFCNTTTNLVKAMAVAITAALATIVIPPTVKLAIAAYMLYQEHTENTAPGNFAAAPMKPNINTGLNSYADIGAGFGMGNPYGPEPVASAVPKPTGRTDNQWAGKKTFDYVTDAMKELFRSINNTVAFENLKKAAEEAAQKLDKIQAPTHDLGIQAGRLFPLMEKAQKFIDKAPSTSLNLADIQPGTFAAAKAQADHDEKVKNEFLSGPKIGSFESGKNIAQNAGGQLLPSMGITGKAIQTGLQTSGDVWTKIISAIVTAIAGLLEPFKVFQAVLASFDALLKSIFAVLSPVIALFELIVTPVLMFIDVLAAVLHPMRAWMESIDDFINNLRKCTQPIQDFFDRVSMAFGGKGKDNTGNQIEIRDDVQHQGVRDDSAAKLAEAAAKKYETPQWKIGEQVAGSMNIQDSLNLIGVAAGKGSDPSGYAEDARAAGASQRVIDIYLQKAKNESLWDPTKSDQSAAQIGGVLARKKSTGGLSYQDYDTLHDWATNYVSDYETNKQKWAGDKTKKNMETPEEMLKIIANSGTLTPELLEDLAKALKDTAASARELNEVFQGLTDNFKLRRSITEAGLFGAGSTPWVGANA